MVIIGAVLRADLKRTVNGAIAMVNLAQSTPVCTDYLQLVCWP
jgi:hypothetical protein